MNNRIFQIVMALLALTTVQCTCQEALWEGLTHTGSGFDPLKGWFTEIPPPTAQPTSTVTVTATQTPIPTSTTTATQTLTRTIVPTGTPTATATVTNTAEPPCLIPLTPPDGAGFDAFGRINFSWESNINAASYAVTVTSPTGTVMTFPVTGNSYSRWIESFFYGGAYTWQVLALDAEGNVLCRSVPVSFKKPVTEPSQTAVPHGVDPAPRGTP
jgi:hypothetical protein